MGIKIMVDSETVFEQDENVPMIHVMTPTGESATLRCQSGDLGADYNYEINLVLDPAQGGIYLDEIEAEDREDNRKRLEGKSNGGLNRNRMGVSDEQLEKLEEDNLARLNQGQGGTNPLGSNVETETPTETPTDIETEKEKELSL